MRLSTADGCCSFCAHIKTSNEVQSSSLITREFTVINYLPSNQRVKLSLGTDAEQLAFYGRNSFARSPRLKGASALTHLPEIHQLLF